MATRINDILKSNREFYFDTYSTRLRKLIVCSTSTIYAIVCGIVAYMIKKHALKWYYLSLSSTQDLGGEEVMSWVMRNVRASQGDRYTIAIIVGTAVLILYIWVINLFCKNYEIYKHRILLTVVPVIIVVCFAGFIVGNLCFQLENINHDLWKIVFDILILIADYLVMIFSERVMVTVEAREASNGFIRFLDFLSDKLIENL